MQRKAANVEPKVAKVQANKEELFYFSETWLRSKFC